MAKNPEHKEVIHKFNGLIGRMGFSIDEILELHESGENISKENLDELLETFEEIKNIWGKLRSEI